MNQDNNKKASTTVTETSDNKIIFARSIEEMRVSLAEMNRFVDEVMVRGEDYDKIPGCGDKPTLLKPGAEKLCQLYNYSPQFAVVESQVSREFVRYLYKCRLIDKDGRVRGEGEGTANSEEPKFRREETIPFFKATEEQKALATRKEERVSKKGAKYTVIVLEASPLGMENTICKMAQKRAFVAATLCTTRLSNKFTQDVEDMSKSTFKNTEEVDAEVVEEPEPKPKSDPADVAQFEIRDRLFEMYGSGNYIENLVRLTEFEGSSGHVDGVQSLADSRLTAGRLATLRGKVSKEYTAWKKGQSK